MKSDFSSANEIGLFAAEIGPGTGLLANKVRLFNLTFLNSDFLEMKADIKKNQFNKSDSFQKSDRQTVFKKR